MKPNGQSLEEELLSSHLALAESFAWFELFNTFSSTFRE
jgi:hypothetical protein